MIRKFSKIFESKNTYKVGLDFHGVIDTMPEFFSFLSNSIIKSGGEIHIITGGLSDKDFELLATYKIKYTKIFSITDYHKQLGTPTKGFHPKFGFALIEDELWDKTKADYCRRENINLHIDDTLQYNDYFTTPFCKLWSNSDK